MTDTPLADAAMARPQQERRQAPRVWRPDVQALRALAVCSVVAYHLWPGTFPGGFVGVDVFLVISGFVVGGALTSEAIGTGSVRLWHFAARRVRRLAPSALVVIALTIVLSAALISPVKQLLWGDSWQTPSVAKDAVASALWIPNLWFMAQDRPYNQDGTSSPYLHFWTLGVEAQFYLLMPFLALLVAALWRRQKRLGFAVVIALGILMIDIGMVLHSLTGSDQFFSPIARLWEFWFGVTIALGMAFAGSSHARLRVAVGALSLVVLAALPLALRQTATWPDFLTFLPVVCTALVLAMNTPAISRLRALTAKPVQALGDWSYVIYLVHWPVIVFGVLIVGSPLAGWETVGALVVTAAGTALIVRFVERPFRARSLATARARRVMLLQFAAATVVVVTLALVAGAWASISSVASGSVASPYQLGPVSESPAARGGPVPANVRPTLAQAEGDLAVVPSGPCMLASGAADEWRKACPYGTAPADQPLVVIVGDSHAEQWIEDLALGGESHGYRVIGITASGCSPLDGLYTPNRQERCARWREWMRAELTELAPELVVATSWTGYVIDGKKASADTYISALPRFFDAVPRASGFAWISDNPQWPSDPVECLADNIDDIARCTLATDAAFNSPVLDGLREQVIARQGAWFDYSNYYCAQSCPPILGDVVVYRDDNHLTQTFVRELQSLVSRDVADAVAAHAS